LYHKFRRNLFSPTLSSCRIRSRTFFFGRSRHTTARNFLFSLHFGNPQTDYYVFLIWIGCLDLQVGKQWCLEFSAGRGKRNYDLNIVVDLPIKKDCENRIRAIVETLDSNKRECECEKLHSNCAIVETLDSNKRECECENLHSNCVAQKEKLIRNKGVIGRRVNTTVL
jgi:hypothetical protein